MDFCSVLVLLFLCKTKPNQTKQTKPNQQKDHNYLKPKTFCVMSLLEEHLQGKMLIAALICRSWKGHKINASLLIKSAVLLSFQFSGFVAFLQFQKY